MRKRTSRPARFAAVDNTAIDTLSSILALGLLTRYIRAQDGESITLDAIRAQYAEGRQSLSKAQRELIAAGFLVRYRIQYATGTWATEFTVDSVRFTPADITAVLAEYDTDDEVRVVRVECADDIRPDEALAPSAGSSPTPPPSVGNPHVGDDLRKHPQNRRSAPSVGFPKVGPSAPLKRNQDSYLETENSSSSPNPSPPPSEPPAPPIEEEEDSTINTPNADTAPAPSAARSRHHDHPRYAEARDILWGIVGGLDRDRIPTGDRADTLLGLIITYLENGATARTITVGCEGRWDGDVYALLHHRLTQRVNTTPAEPPVRPSTSVRRTDPWCGRCDQRTGRVMTDDGSWGTDICACATNATLPHAA